MPRALGRWSRVAAKSRVPMMSVKRDASIAILRSGGHRLARVEHGACNGNVVVVVVVRGVDDVSSMLVAVLCSSHLLRLRATPAFQVKDPCPCARWLQKLPNNAKATNVRTRCARAMQTELLDGCTEVRAGTS